MRAVVRTWAWRLSIIVVSTVVALLLAAGAALVFERHRIAQFNRTHNGPLKIKQDDPVLMDAARLMETLKPFGGSDSLRFAAMPSFGKRWFAVGMQRNGGEALVKVGIENRPSARIEVRTFIVSKQDFDRMVGKWDAVTDRYSGEGRMLTDGTPLVFERRRGNRFTSGVGNSPCHYDVLGDLAAQSLGGQVPELNDLREPYLPRLLASASC